MSIVSHKANLLALTFNLEIKYLYVGKKNNPWGEMAS